MRVGVGGARSAPPTPARFALATKRRWWTYDTRTTYHTRVNTREKREPRGRSSAATELRDQ